MSELAENRVATADTGGTEEPKSGLSRYWYLPRPMKVIFIGGSMAAMIFFILFWFSIPIFGEVLTSTRYYFILYATLGFNIFIGVGATKAQKRRAPPWFDYVLASILWGIIIYFLIHHHEIGNKLWVEDPTLLQYSLATIMGLFAIEGARRIGGCGALPAGRLNVACYNRSLDTRSRPRTRGDRPENTPSGSEGENTAPTC